MSVVKTSFSTQDKIDKNEDEIDEASSHIYGSPYEYFEIDKCVNFIISNPHISDICLQFPDSLLNYSSYVANILKEKTGKKCYILADTSHASCCVDEVAAKHVNAHALIHFGHSCLSRTETLPVLYIFGKSHLDIEDFISKLLSSFEDDENIIFFYDILFNHVIDELKDKVSLVFNNAVFSKLAIDRDINDSDNYDKIFGRLFQLRQPLDDYKIVFIGEEGTTLNNFILHFNKNLVFSYSACRNELRKENFAVNKFLMKRFYLIEKAKDAIIVGIVVGTLAVAKYRDVLERIKMVLKNAGKKFYVFLVGKINVAKLANFMEIDIFVNIACAESSNIDSKDFYKPIITPYELEVACLSNREWKTEYVVEFSQLLPGACHHVGIEEDNDETKEPEYSLITGQLRSTRLNKGQDSENSTDVAIRGASGELVDYKPQNALEYLASREWKGLDKDAHIDVKKAQEGRSGIAMSYKNENL